jgi:hypothetical protein
LTKRGLQRLTAQRGQQLFGFLLLAFLRPFHTEHDDLRVFT